MAKTPLPLKVGDVVRLKKPHPCGNYHWEITRTGMDLGIHCLGCGRRVMVPRVNLERRIREIVPSENLPENLKKNLQRQPRREE